MEYSVETTINLPRGRVIELFDNPDNLAKWQKGLISFAHASGTPGQAGARSDIVYRMGKRQITMVETIVKRDLPDEFTATYETDGVFNRCANHFIENPDGSTTWRQDNVFECTGLMMRLMTTFAPFMFRKQSLSAMNDFKAFAESA